MSFLDTPPVDETRPDCPNQSKHTRAPVGYMQWHPWAERMKKTHDQTQCPGCGRWQIWLPKSRVNRKRTKVA